MSSPIIDIHVHFGAPNDPQSGCFWSDEFAKGIAYYAFLLITGSLFKKIDIDYIRQRLLDTLNASHYTSKAVFLAMDMVYDEFHNPHPEKTHLYVPNDYIAQLAATNPNKVLFGASIHPFNPNWKQELHNCLEKKAVLCKWIPSTQLINPDDSRLDEFYAELADHKVPLLCHGGPEISIPTSDKTYNEFNNPKYLKRPLMAGVNVIVAHCATPYFGLIDVDYQDDFDDLIKLYNETVPLANPGWGEFYADLSAMCIPTRSPYLERLKNELTDTSRLIYASDYPILISAFSYGQPTNIFARALSLIRLTLTKNLLDKNYLIIKDMGFDDRIYSNAQTLFDQIIYPP